MVQMKSQSSNLINIKKILSIYILFTILIVLSACQKNEYPRPTNAFYINDYANILYEATRDSIRREGERLYENTQDKTDGGTQLVITTFEVKEIDDISNYDKTDLYRQWRIGDDDMGVLVLLFFKPYTENDIEYLELVETQIELGYRMEQYISPTQLGVIIDNTLYSDEWDDLDLAVMNMEYELLSAIYVDVYNYESFDYSMSVFQEYLINNPDTSYEEPIPMSLILFLLSPFSTWGEKLSAVLPILFVFILGGGFIMNKGGGGSSGGAGIFRRRR